MPRSAEFVPSPTASEVSVIAGPLDIQKDLAKDLATLTPATCDYMYDIIKITIL